jgi:glycolate oxidase
MADYNKLNADIIEQLKAIAPNRVYAGDDINEDFTHDEMPIYGKFSPDAVVEALTTEEVAAVLKVCNENKIPVTTRGAGTGLAGGSTPIAGGVVLGVDKMNKILNIDTENLSATVQAGVLLQDLYDAVAEKGLFYPPDPGQKFATLGGNVSTNAGGMRAVKYGTTRDYVRAMTVVTAGGDIIKLGANVKKSSTGYSLLHLMIGSEGTLGVVTEVTLKLIPAPKAQISLIVPFEDITAAISAVPKLLVSGLNPQALEFMEEDIVRMGEEYLDKEVFPKEFDGVEAKAYLLTTFDGDDMERLEGVSEQASEVLFDAGALDVLVADTPDRIKSAWLARDAFYPAITESTSELDECDVVVPITLVADYLNFVRTLQDKHGIRIRCYGHSGDGNIHIYLLRDDLPEEEFMSKVEAAMDEMYDKANELGGLVSGEHGIGHAKQAYLEKCVGPVQIALMQSVKKAFDPNLILNPGKVCYKL